MIQSCQGRVGQEGRWPAAFLLRLATAEERTGSAEPARRAMMHHSQRAPPRETRTARLPRDERLLPRPEISASLAGLRIRRNNAGPRRRKGDLRKERGSRSAVGRDTGSAKTQPIGRSRQFASRGHVVKSRTVAGVGTIVRARQQNLATLLRGLVWRALHGQAGVADRSVVRLQQAPRDQLTSLAAELPIEPRRPEQQPLDFAPAVPRGGGSSADEPCFG